MKKVKEIIHFFLLHVDIKFSVETVWFNGRESNEGFQWFLEALLIQ